uniref:Uncharacterized protein n=1 Tax=Rhizophora mucronata TaxID=61149 RepID=A0A2P2QKC7_RHIMU
MMDVFLRYVLHCNLFRGTILNLTCGL